MQNIANKITLARILFLPIFIIILASDINNKEWFAAFAFALLAISDGLDGYLARSLNQVTSFGKILDPIADKIVIGAALITLIYVANLPVWAVIIILGREIAVSVLRIFASKKNVVISASKLGKIKTVTQITAVFFWIFNISGDIFIINIFSWIVLILAVIISVVSGLDYFKKFREIWKPK